MPSFMTALIISALLGASGMNPVMLIIISGLLGFYHKELFGSKEK